MGVRVVELFAGVGGFRRGFEDTKLPYETVWFNQWEPSAKAQHAHDCYLANFHPNGDAPEMTNHDVLDVTANHINVVPGHDLLVGGFPCQDYSVATTLDKSGGLDGSKGRLWWAIDDILRAKQPPYVLLENVNTLLTKPASQRGRSFGVILSCLAQHGYAVEWRVLNAAEYGAAQRRRRVFIFAAHKDTGIGKMMTQKAAGANYLDEAGFFAHGFPVKSLGLEGHSAPSGIVPGDPTRASIEFTGRFENAGIMVRGRYWTHRVHAQKPIATPIRKILEAGPVAETYFVDESRWADWEYQKGAKAEPRIANPGKPNEYAYMFKEGAMAPIDEWNKPSRTILTSEANRTPNRSTHIVIDPATGRKRFLTPLECERLNGFPDNWTKSLPQRWRYFTMGNALVVSLVTTMGHILADWIAQHEPKATIERQAVEHPPRRSKASRST